MTGPSMVSETDRISIRLHGLARESITDGPGIRFAIFTQGCPHQCDGCHNPESHAFNDGYVVPIDRLIDDFKANPLLDGITLSGGEPFLQAPECSLLASAARLAGLHVLVFSGYTWEELSEQADLRKGWRELLLQTDVLIDGRYERAQRSLALRFRGSRNQRAIDVQASLAANNAIEFAL